MSELATLIGERVRALRAERGLSLGALARAAEVGKGSLSEIENGARNPTIATLYALAKALEVPFASLLADRAGTEVGTPGFSALLLDVHDAGDRAVEVYRLRFGPGAVREADGHRSGVTEHLTVTAGRLWVGAAAAPVQLSPGESTSWASDVAHVYATVGDEPAEAVLVMRSPRSSRPGDESEPPATS